MLSGAVYELSYLLTYYHHYESRVNVVYYPRRRLAGVMFAPVAE